VVVLNGSNYYQCTTAESPLARALGPPAPAPAIVDGTALWNYLPPFTFPTATTDWRLGAWGAALGYPAYRQVLAGAAAWWPDLSASQTGSMPRWWRISPTWRPSAGDGTVTDANALSWILDDDEVNAIRALSPAGSAQSAQLAIFTDGGEHMEQAASAAQALTPTSVQIYRETSYGANANVDPIRIGKSGAVRRPAGIARSENLLSIGRPTAIWRRTSCSSTITSPRPRPEPAGIAKWHQVVGLSAGAVPSDLGRAQQRQADQYHL
jgi:hypothetical protein